MMKRTWAWAATALLAATTARADAVTDWNVIAVRATETAGAPVPVQTRVMSLVHAAVFDAVNAIERKYAPYAVEVRPGPAASAEAAAAAAAHGVLERVYPLQKPIHDAALTAALGKIADSPERAQGVRLGQEVAERIFALRKDDGAAAQVAYQFASGPGVYQATPPMNASPVLPHWRSLRPFIITGARQFAWHGPPPLASAGFARDFNEVKRIGGRSSIERTNEQTAIAIHWAGSEVPPLNAVARAAAAAKGLGLADSARLFALLNMAMADSLIAGFEAKYAVNYWRPVTAIRNGDLDGNAATVQDAAWSSYIVTPPHPSYISGHSGVAGSAAAILSDAFGDASPLCIGWASLDRCWGSYGAAADDAAMSRLWGGIHWRFDNEAGTALGRSVAEWTLGQSAFAAVPEPGSWAMLIAGFGLVGGVMRRRGAATASG